LIYSQFYALIKTPFDTSKVHVFDNESLENLALDPGYILSILGKPTYCRSDFLCAVDRPAAEKGAQ